MAFLPPRPPTERTTTMRKFLLTSLVVGFVALVGTACQSSSTSPSACSANNHRGVTMQLIGATASECDAVVAMFQDDLGSLDGVSAPDCAASADGRTVVFSGLSSEDCVLFQDGFNGR